MMSYLVDILFVLVASATAYYVSRKLFVHSVIGLICVLISSLFAIGTFEVVTYWVIRNLFLASDSFFTIYLWSPIALGLFGTAMGVLVCLVKSILPDPPEMSNFLEGIGCWITGLLSGYLLASFVLTVSHTFPASRNYGGAFPPEVQFRSGPVMAFAPDYQFLALTEYICEDTSALARGEWSLGRPVISAQMNRGRWSAFPIRFALWREQIHRVSLSEDD